MKQGAAQDYWSNKNRGLVIGLNSAATGDVKERQETEYGSQKTEFGTLETGHSRRNLRLGDTNASLMVGINTGLFRDSDS